MRLFPLTVLAAVAVACAPPSRSDGGGDTDGGSTIHCATNKSTRHESYVPDDFTPKDVARLVVMGDSISTGTGLSNPQKAQTDSYFGLLDKNDDTTWPLELGHDLATYYKHDVPVVNVAVSGAVTKDLAAQLQHLEAQVAAPADHSMVVITIGGNDLQGALISSFLGQNVDPTGQVMTDALANIRAAVTELEDPAKFPGGVSIYLMDVYDPTDGQGQAHGCFYDQSAPQFIPALDTWRTKYIELGTELHFSVVDALGHFHGHGWNYSDKTNQYYQASDATVWFANDCIHPNDRGHDELRRLFYEALDCTYVATP